jgi:hypothetical protein
MRSSALPTTVAMKIEPPPSGIGRLSIRAKPSSRASTSTSQDDGVVRVEVVDGDRERTARARRLEVRGHIGPRRAEERQDDLGRLADHLGDDLVFDRRRHAALDQQCGCRVVDRVILMA